MKSHTSLVAQQTRLSEWTELIRDCQSRPQGMKIDEWCQLHGITKAFVFITLLFPILCSSDINTISRTNCGRGPISVIVPPDVKVETTFFQRNFFITEPCTYPRKIAQKKNLRFLRSPYFTPFL